MDFPTKLYRGTADSHAPILYFIDLPEHPFDLKTAAEGLAMSVAAVSVPNWDDALSPWKAPALYREQAAFGGGASKTLETLLRGTMPEVESTNGLDPRCRAIGGYSLGGLFATWAFLSDGTFKAMASMSGSLWFDGWDEFCRRACQGDGSDEKALAGRFAYLSVGTGEKRASSSTFRRVEDRTQETAQLMKEAGVRVEFCTGPGKHFDHVTERITRGLKAVDQFLQG